MSAWIRVLLGGTALLAATAAVTIVLGARTQDGFPHAAHTGLFPLCIGCHLGVETGERAAYYPDPASCMQCHDGERERIVDWTGPAARSSNLEFEHRAHDAVVMGEGMAPLACEQCHTQPGALRMQVEPPIPERCFDCHAHTAREHFVDAECSVCHVPLAESTLPAGRLAALPVPASHLRADFVEAAHGTLAFDAIQSCTTCHVREQCTSCHVAVPPGSPIAAVPAADGRVAVLPIAARYPVPASHLAPDWERRHGDVATPATCATCHTRESCTNCHIPPLPGVVAQLPRARDVAAPGAFIARRMPASHATPFFASEHGALAAARPQTCATCHERTSFCGACHEPGTASAAPAARPARDASFVAAVSALVAADTLPPPPRAATPRTPRGFHPPNYVLRHSAEAFGRRLDCSSCHNTQLFCRDCHVNAGRGSTGRLGPGYHTAEPVWLLRHGQAARQTLESCTSCHTQRDCMQCHSQLGAFRVNPHGPGFNAERARRANPQICRACHLQF